MDSLCTQLQETKIHSEVLFDLLDKFGFLVVKNDKRWIRKVLLATLFFVSLLIYVVGLFDPLGDILEYGKFLNQFMGVVIGISKFAFLLCNSQAVRGIIDRIKEKSIIWRGQDESDEEVKRICSRYFKQQMKFIFVGCTFEITNMTLLLIDSMFHVPQRMILGDFDGELGSPQYYAQNILQYFSCVFVDLCYVLTDLLIGGIYREIIKELEIINYKMQKLTTPGITCAEKYQRLIEIAKRYQEIRVIIEDFGDLLTWFLGIYLGFVFSVMICICVEFAILVNENVEHCLEPLYYLLFMNISFFYWCWLGNSMLEKSQDIIQSSFVYDPETDDRRMRKTLLMFQQMVSRPLRINVRPVFTLNYQLFIAVLQASYKFTTILKDINASGK